MNRPIKTFKELLHELAWAKEQGVPLDAPVVFLANRSGTNIAESLTYDLLGEHKELIIRLEPREG